MFFYCSLNYLYYERLQRYRCCSCFIFTVKIKYFDFLHMVWLVDFMHIKNTFVFFLPSQYFIFFLFVFAQLNEIRLQSAVMKCVKDVYRTDHNEMKILYGEEQFQYDDDRVLCYIRSINKNRHSDWFWILQILNIIIAFKYWPIICTRISPKHNFNV